MKVSSMKCINALVLGVCFVSTCDVPCLAQQEPKPTATTLAEDPTTSGTNTKRSDLPTLASGNNIDLSSSAPPAAVFEGNFFERLGHFYVQDWKGTATPSVTPARRALSAPLD